jgi:tetratricopeptide (TPR) repeat protein
VRPSIRWLVRRAGGEGLLTVTMLVGALAVGACERRPAPPRVASLSHGRLVPVEWAGCAVERMGRHCELGAADRKLVIWAPGNEAAHWTFAADGRPLKKPAAVPMQDGWQITVVVPGTTRRLSATRPVDDGEVWSLAVDQAIPHSEIDDLVVAGKRGDPGAAPRLRNIIDKGDPHLRGRAEAGYARVMLARGDMNEAEPAFRRALAADRAEGRLSDEMRDGVALIWGLATLQQRFADARVVLESLASARDQFPEGQALYAYSEGLLAAETDDLRTALASYRTVARVWERLGRIAFANDAAEDLGRILVVMGRSEEAVSILERLPGKKDPCAHASLMINRAEAIIEAATHNRNIAEVQVTRALAEEQEATRTCPDPHRRFMATIHAARRALSIGNIERTDALVTQLRSVPEDEDALSKAWRAEVLGSWWLARGNARGALRSFDEQATVARAVGLRDERLRAEVGAGEALLALGRRREGVVRLRNAQALLQTTLEGIPISEGRGEFLGSHDEGVRHLVDALVDGGAVSEALAVARIARSTEVSHAAKLDRLQRLSAEQRRQWDEALGRYAHIRRAIEQESLEDWKIPGLARARAGADREIRASEAREALDSAYNLLVDRHAGSIRALPAPQTDALEITFFPGTKDWIAFTQSRLGVQARRFRDEALDSNLTASAILDQLSPALAIAHRVDIMPFGRSDRIDWHAVNWRGAPLVATHEVVYRLDLPDASDQTRPGETSTAALVVANPTGDLRAAEAEGGRVAQALMGWRVTRLESGQATRDALLNALPKAGLFHFAGHADLAGPIGASSALILAGGARVQLGDLLALPRLPRVVILSACKAAASVGAVTDAPSTSVMGLAQTFLAAGSRAVVAPIRDVDDAEAQAFMTNLYETLTSQGLGRLTKAFQNAAVGAVGKSSQSFRLVIQ